MASLRSAFFFLYRLNVSLNRSTTITCSVMLWILNNARYPRGGCVCVRVTMSVSDSSVASGRDEEVHDSGSEEEEEDHIRQGIE